MNTLETFAPIPRIVTLNNGQRIEILPLRLGQMPAFTQAVMPITGSLFLADYFTILEEHPAAALNMLVAACMTREQAEQVFQDETVALLAAIYEVNSDFFIQRLRPAMTRAAAGAQAVITALMTVGAPSSPGLPGTDIPSPPL